MAGSSGEVSSVPPGFRFHPTEEELLYYYLRKKVSYQPIHDLDVITEVDLNKLEPWDLKDKCRIGSGPQNDWYFFSHKDKKYPSGTRTNRATAAGFWKATGRDKAIHHSTNSNRSIGMRKTLVFYTGRAPRGHKTDWIMHEYRLDDQEYYASHHELQEDGWVICRVFTKKNQTRSGCQFHLDSDQEQHFIMPCNSTTANGDSDSYTLQPKQQYSTNCDHEARYNHNSTSILVDLPQLHSPESTVPIPLILSSYITAASMPIRSIDEYYYHGPAVMSTLQYDKISSFHPTGGEVPLYR